MSPNDRKLLLQNPLLSPWFEPRLIRKIRDVKSKPDWPFGRAVCCFGQCGFNGVLLVFICHDHPFVVVILTTSTCSKMQRSNKYLLGILVFRYARPCPGFLYFWLFDSPFFKFFSLSFDKSFLQLLFDLWNYEYEIIFMNYWLKIVDKTTWNSDSMNIKLHEQSINKDYRTNSMEKNV